MGGRVGYFPSAYVMRVESGQKTLQVTRNLHLTDQITLLRDQVLNFTVCIMFAISSFISSVSEASFEPIINYILICTS